MRFLLLVAGLAVLAAGVSAEDAVADVVPEAVADAEPEDMALDLSEDMMARLLGDLFDDDDFDEAVEQQESNREARARGDDEAEAVEEEKAVIDPKDQARYNSFVDTFFRRLNSYARSRFDPLSVGLVGRKSPKKGGADKKGKSEGGANKKKGKKSGKGKKAGKKGGKKGKKSGSKKKGRHPKDLDLDELEEEQPEEGAVEVEEEEEESHDISKREAEVVEVVDIEEEEEDEEELEEEEEDEDSISRVTRDAEEGEEVDAAEETARRGKPAKGGRKGANKNGRKRKGDKKGKGANKRGDKKGGKKAGKKGGGKKTGKKAGKNGNKSKRSTKGSKSRTSRASVTGIATVKRAGDVKVTNKKGGKEMRAQFTLGPVDLKVNRKYGKGKDAVVKEARALSPELTGKLSIHVARDGKARMTNFRINRPAIVQVEGSLRKSTKGGKNDNNFMEKSISKFSPVASKKLKAASRDILSAGEPKAQTDA